jgi:hypothetical protein
VFVTVTDDCWFAAIVTVGGFAPPGEYVTLLAEPVPVSVTEHCVPAGIPVIGNGPPPVSAPDESNVNVRS